MAAESAQEFEALEAQAATLLESFKRAGYERVAPSIIQPAEIFLDQIGEAIRGRSYVFTDLNGVELCLRPDLTVPVSRLYLERHPLADTEARYCYNGPAFRFQPSGGDRTHPREFRQAGIECFGVADRDSADVEIVMGAVEAVRSVDMKEFTLRFGDIAMFYALIEALDLPERWRLKLRHYFWRRSAFYGLLAQLAKGEPPESAGPVDDLAMQLPEQPERAEAEVAVYLDDQNLPLTGNRALAEITARLLDHAADLRAEPLPQEAATIIDSYLAVSGRPLKAADRIAVIAKGAGIDFGPALDGLVSRFERLRDGGLDPEACNFATEFGRDLEYYSGLVFQIEAGADKEAVNVAGGGRYDGLLAALGAPREVPAVGCAVHTERLLASRGGLSR
jgi:ATP phosphoribosyltransferase regulatory subunit